MNSKKIIRFFILFDVIILILLGSYWYLNQEKKTLDDSVRSMATGDFVELSDGFTHYELSGPTGGDLVVLVHGFSVPYYIWDPTVEGLTKAGYQVLRYDLFGRGYSDRPEATYDLELFVKQLDELTRQVIPDQKFNLVGLSMGGPIVASYVNKHPEMIESVTFIAPEIEKVSAADIFPMNVPLLGEWFTGVYLVPYRLPQTQPDDFYRPENFPDWVQKYTDQLQYKGFKRAILSTIRNLTGYDPYGIYEEYAENGFPTFLIWGTEDQTISRQGITIFMQAVPGVEYLFVEEAGHLPHYEQADLVNTALIEFYQSIQPVE